MDEKAAVLLASERAWVEFRSALEAIPEGRMADAGAEGGFSPRDIAGHVAMWMQDRVKQVRAHLEHGEPLPTRRADLDAFNQAQAALRRSLPLETVLSELERAHAELAGFMAAMPTSCFHPDSPVRQRIEVVAVRHLENHARDLRAWLEGRATLTP